MQQHASFPVDGKDASRAPFDPEFHFLVAGGAAAFLISLVAFAWAQVGVGVAAFVVSLLALGAGLASFSMEGRRMRHVERERLISRRLVKHGR